MADEEEVVGGGVEEAAEAPVVTDADGEVVAQGEAAADAGAPSEAYEWQGVADYARQYGVDLPGSDAQALQTLLSAYRQSQQRNFYADYGMRMAPYADQIQAWIAQQSAVQAAPPARPAWQPPEWDPRWLQMVERDPNTGHLYAKPGVDPRIADKVLAYADWQDRFRENPGAVIQPMVEARAREIVNQEFASYRQNATADRLVAQNANWMFAYQPNGAPILMQDESRALSPAGVLYARSVNQIWIFFPPRGARSCPAERGTAQGRHPGAPRRRQHGPQSSRQLARLIVQRNPQKFWTIVSREQRLCIKIMILSIRACHACSIAS